MQSVRLMPFGTMDAVSFKFLKFFGFIALAKANYLGERLEQPVAEGYSQPHGGNL